MNKDRLLLVIVGASGSGKTMLTEECIGKSNKIITCTTRDKRDGEVDGVDYHFITKELFKEYLDKNKFFEYTLYDGNLYGTLKEDLRNFTGLKYIITDIDGYKKIHRSPYVYDKGIYIYAKKEKIKEALIKRNNGLYNEDVKSRLKLYDKEVLNKYHFTNKIENDYTDKSIKEMSEMVNYLKRDLN